MVRTVVLPNGRPPAVVYRPPPPPPAAVVTDDPVWGDTGINPKLFGPHFWRLSFSLAGAVDAELARLPVGSPEVDTLTVDATRALCAVSYVLPCRACRDSSQQLVADARIGFACQFADQLRTAAPAIGADRRQRGQPSFVASVHWWKTLVNRKLGRQRVAAAAAALGEGGGEAAVAQVRADWRRSIVRLSQMSPAAVVTLQSREFAAALVWAVWWICHSAPARQQLASWAHCWSQLLRRLPGGAAWSIFLDRVLRDADGEPRLPDQRTVWLQQAHAALMAAAAAKSSTAVDSTRHNNSPHHGR